MNYLLDNNDALRMSPLGRSVLFHLHKPCSEADSKPFFPIPCYYVLCVTGKQCHRLHSFSTCFDLQTYGFAWREGYQN